MAQLWTEAEMEEDGRRFTSSGWVVRPITRDNECLAAMELPSSTLQRGDQSSPSCSTRPSRSSFRRWASTDIAAASCRNSGTSV